MAEFWLHRARAYLRTAQAAYQNGDLDPAYENARLATELACKHRLSLHGIPFDRQHNVAPLMAQRGLLGRDGPASRLSRFLQDHTRARYGADAGATDEDVRDAITIAYDALAVAEADPGPS